MADEMGVEQKIDMLVDRFGSLERKVDALGQSFGTLERKIETMDQRFDAMDQRFDAMDQRLDAMDRKFSVQFEAVRADIRLVAEGVDAGNQRLDRAAAEAREHHNAQHQLLVQVNRHLRVRVEHLEDRRPRRRK